MPDCRSRIGHKSALSPLQSAANEDAESLLGIHERTPRPIESVLIGFALLRLLVHFRVPVSPAPSSLIDQLIIMGWRTGQVEPWSGPRVLSVLRVSMRRSDDLDDSRFESSETLQVVICGLRYGVDDGT